MRRKSLEVWALEPYFGGSHRAFLEGLAAHSRHHFTLFTMPGRNWKWRMHGASLSLAEQVLEHHDSIGTRPDAFFASDMLDLGVFLAAVGPVLGRVPTILYLHENQLTYPLPPEVPRDLTYGFKNVTSAAVADAVIFNSEFHRREFLQAAAELLRAMPDEVPEKALGQMAERSSVVYVGCDLRRFDQRGGQDAPCDGQSRWGDSAAGPLLLWNQRWEYDKAPGDLFAALYELQDSGARFRLAMAGPNQGTPTAEFLEARERLAEHIVQWGKVQTGADYISLLWEADVVVSTALHEFFGIAIVEAIYCGCRPVLPKRLSYLEIIPGEAHAEVLYDVGGLPRALTRALSEPDAWPRDWQRTWVARFDWGALVGVYDQAVADCCRGGSGGAVRLNRMYELGEAGL